MPTQEELYEKGVWLPNYDEPSDHLMQSAGIRFEVK